MAKHRTLVGLHARNDVRFTEPDYQLVRWSRIELVKMMSFTEPAVFSRLRRENPDIEFIVRLYDSRTRANSRSSPADFVARMVPIIARLQPYTTKFEIHNEPNHAERVEGWGASDDNAQSFRSWYRQVLALLRQAAPWAEFGFPGLALNHPHRDLAWLGICRDVIQASDWLGCHCYWQYGNMLDNQWGLRFKLYHERFPAKQIEITEFGNSTPNLAREEVARQYAAYYTELNKYPYLGSASAFIASSSDPAWSPFVWMKEGGEMLPVVHAVGSMERVPVEVEPTPPPEPVPPPEPAPPAERFFRETGKTVRGAFLQFFDNYGLDICGYPITEQFEEYGFPSQYFQRVALELLRSGDIRLKLAGTEAWTSRARIAELEERIEELSQLPTPGGPVKPPMTDLVDDLLRHATKAYPTRQLSEVRQVVMHHTATSPAVTPQRLAQYQVRTLDKPGIIYHFVVAADGTIYQVNRLETVSDHAYRRNRESIGVVFPGNFTKSVPPASQLDAGAQLCAWLLGTLRMPLDAIVGLSEFVATQSPGKQWLSGQKWKGMLLDRVEDALEAGGEGEEALIASLRARIAELEAKFEGQETLIASLRARIAELEAGSEGEEALIASLRARIAELEAEVEGEEALIASLRARIAELEAGGEGQEALVASLRTQIAELEAEVEALREQLGEQPPPAPLPEPAGVSKPPIENLIDRLAKHATKRYGARSLDKITTLVVHHSAVPPSVGPQRIAEYHVDSLDWPGVGYHFLVSEDGILYQGNRLETVSYHAVQANPYGVGICFLGNFTKKVPPPAQLRAGAHLIAWLMQELDVKLDEVVGHKEVLATQCPGAQWLQDREWKQMLRQEIAQVQQEASEPMPVPEGKPIFHYMLFWSHDGEWAEQDWINARNYIGAFHPAAGVSVQDAAHAEYVTIVGGPLGVTGQVEEWLLAGGSNVERIAGEDEADTKRLLDEMVAEGRRFRTFDA